MYFDRKKFFDGFRAWRGHITEDQVKGINFLLTEIERDTQIDLIPEAAYLLATSFHETAATMLPIREYGKGRGRKYAKVYTVSLPNGGTVQVVYYGRGFVQLTWDYNYREMTRAILANYPVIVSDFERNTGKKFNLVTDPDQALYPPIAYAVMSYGMRTGKFGAKLGTYINAQKTDYVNARRTVNVMDKAEKIAGYAKEFEKILRNSKTNDPAQSVFYGEQSLFPETEGIDSEQEFKTMSDKSVFVPGDTLEQQTFQPTPFDPSEPPSADIPSVATEEPIETPTNSENAPSEQPQTTKIEMSDGKVKAEMTSDSNPPEKIAIEKPKKQGFLATIRTEIGLLFMGNGGFQGAIDKFQQVGALGLSPGFWRTIGYLAIGATLIYLLMRYLRWRKGEDTEDKRTELLVTANSTDTNKVTLAATEDLETLKAKGYTIVRRGE